MTLDDLKLIRVHALKVEYLVLAETVADTMMELLGEFPDGVKVIVLKDYSKGRNAPKTGRTASDPDYPLPGGPGPSSAVLELRAKMEALQARMDALTAAQRTMNP